MVIPLIFALLACSDYELHSPGDGQAPLDDTGADRPHDDGTPDDSTTDTAGPAAPDPDGSLTETFTVAGEELPADIVFFGDTSGSMSEELETLGERASEFIERLASYAGDWHLMAVTDWEGCGNGGIITPSTPDYAQRFADGITEDPWFGAFSEAGLYVMNNVLMETQIGGCNAGFLREDALLHIVIVSDENDESPGEAWDSSWWQDYVDKMMGYKADPSLFKISAVIGPPPDGCKGADPGHGYAEAVDYTGGEMFSICDEWQDQLDVLAQASVQQTTFLLDDRPQKGSITVEKNGTTVTTWEYDANLNAVRFTSDIPQGGDVVEINYIPV